MDLFAAVGIPVIGWAFYVERRLAQIADVKEQLEKLDRKIDTIMNHLISTS